MPIRFGLYLNVQLPPGQSPRRHFEDLLEQVRLARQAGFDSVFCGHHYLAGPYQMFQPVPLLARLAAEAEGMLVGTGIMLLSLANPVDVAESLATLDVITGGRLICGFGLGYRDVEFRAFGLTRADAARRFRRNLILVKRLWSAEPVSHHDMDLILEGARLALLPLQRPHPPVWLAANGDAAVRRTARLGEIWFLNPHVRLENLARQRQLYLETLRVAGRPDPGEVPILRECFVAETGEKARRAAAPFLEAKYKTYSGWGQDAVLPGGERFEDDFEQLAAGRFLVGGPEECAEGLLQHHGVLGANHFVLRLQWPGLPQRQALRAIELLGETVIPSVRRLAASGRTGPV